MSVLLLTLLAPLASAGTLAGVTMDDSATVGGQKLVLNGMGLREKFWIDIYVGGLYLPAKTSDAAKAIKDDVPKRIAMEFTYGLSAKQLASTLEDGIGKAGEPEATKHVETFSSWMEDVDKGDVILLDYVPGEGTSVTVKGKKKGTLPGTSLMRALFTVYLGPNPPTKALKSGLLGG